jgi:molybdenum cofactor cytidylyltransferase
LIRKNLSDAGLHSTAVNESVAAIVLAAGASTRFGANKLLYPFTIHGLTLPLAAHSLRPWLDTFERVTVVVKAEEENFCREIETALGNAASAKIHWCVCRHAVQGMAASLACGVQANVGARAWLIGLADMPAVPQQALVDVHAALLSGAKLVAPFKNSRRGHPVGFASEYREDLLSLQGDEGARQILARDKEKIIALQIDDAGIFADIDIPSDLLRF